MRRAIRCSVWILIAAALLPTAPSAEVRRPSMINAIGLLDYSRKPDLKVGQYAKYHFTSTTATGYTDDYVVTVAVVGEERFWGEDCFWLETSNEPKGRPPIVVATLMSYDIFKDPDATRNMLVYQRKMVNGLDDEGKPQIQLMKRPAESLKQRNRTMATSHVYFDTLGTDTVQVPGGNFTAHVLRIRQASSTSGDTRDSTQYTELRETRTVQLSDRVPVTGVVREDVDYLYQRKTWLIGRSDTGQLVTLEHAIGRGNLLESGAGYQSALLPPEMQHGLPPAGKAAVVAERTPAPAKRATPARRPAPKR